MQQIKILKFQPKSHLIDKLFTMGFTHGVLDFVHRNHTQFTVVSAELHPS